MTPLQWLFHYAEVKKFKGIEYKRENSMLDLIVDRLEVLWLTTNYEMGKELLEMKKKDKIKSGNNTNETNKSGSEITPENFTEQWAKIMQVVPHELDFTDEYKKRITFSLPTFSRNQLREKALQGIQIEPK